MAEKKTATKTSQKANSNININISSKNTKKITNKTKKLGVKAICFAFVFLFVGMVIGAGVWLIGCRNDTFELIGSDELSMELGEYYDDPGVKIIAFGVDCSSDFQVETDLLIEDGKYYADEIGTYYIKYTTSNWKYGKLFSIQKIRLITFLEPSDGGE